MTDNELAEQLQTIRAAFAEIKTLLGETDIHIAAMQQQIAALTALFFACLAVGSTTGGPSPGTSITQTPRCPPIFAPPLIRLSRSN